MDPTKLERNEGEKTTDNTPTYHGDQSPRETVNEGPSPPQPTEATSKGPPPPRPQETTSKGPPPPQPTEVTTKGPPPPKPHEVTSKGPPPPQPVDNEPSSQETGNEVSPAQPMEATSKGPSPPKPHETTSKGPPPPQPVDNGPSSQETGNDVSSPAQPMEATSKGPPPPKPYETTSKGPPPPQPTVLTTKGPPPPRPHEVTSKGPPPSQSLEALLQPIEGEGWNTLKLVIMGDSGVGKTTLLHQMNNIKKWQFPWMKKADLIPSTTIGVEYSQIKIGKRHVLVWDLSGLLEYSVTNQLLLSSEMVIYILCYDLSATTQSQHEQVSYWLDFLQSSLPCHLTSASKWKVVMVGTKSDACPDLPSVKQLNPIPAWQRLWPNLPLHPQHFITSSHSKNSIRRLFESVETICNHIVQDHTTLIPKSYKSLLTLIQAYSKQNPIMLLSQLKAEFVKEEDGSLFQDALRHLHAIGQIVWFAQSRPQMVCLQPQMIPSIAAEFISPANVRAKLINARRIEVFETQQIASILDVATEDVELQQKLSLMEHLGLCFKLISEKGSVPSYLFPSLGYKSGDIDFAISKSSEFQLCGVRIIAPRSLIFTSSFFCMLVVNLCRTLNITKDELFRVHANVIVITCRGMFTGQLILKVEEASKSMVLLLLAFNPDLSFVEHVLNTLIETKFTQYAGFSKRYLCPVCIEQYTSRSEEIGTIEIGNELQRCDPHLHALTKYGLRAPNPLSLVHECYTHKQAKHNFFLSYSVATEGKKAPFQTKEEAGGFVELIYEHLAPQKIGTQPIFVFWDKKCLHQGQDWEDGYLHGITSSSVIILILSNKVIERICNTAPTNQDNVLLEYECALLQNRLKGVPVIPLFVAEMTGDNQFEIFDFRKANTTLPDVPHLRSDKANHIISDLRQSLPAKKASFLSSIKKTMDKIFRLQGIFLPKRGEDEQAIDEFVAKAIEIAQQYM